MVLEIRLGEKREKRLYKHLEKEHPSTKGNMKIKKKCSINKIIRNVPNYKKQAKEYTKI